MKTFLVFTIIGLILFWGAEKLFSIEGYGVGPLEITEQDKSPDGYPSVLVVPGGALTYDATNTTATLTVATLDQVNSTFTALSLSTATLGLTASNTNYVNLSGSMQTKTGGLNVLGNLGIGTSSPNSKLHVVPSDGYSSGWLKGIISTGANVIENGNAAIGMHTDKSMYFMTKGLGDYTSSSWGTSVAMKIQNDGYVGIGSIYPESNLHISGSIPVVTLQGENEFLGPQMRFRVSGGTLGSPTIVTQPDFYNGALYWDAYNGSAWKGVGAFLVNGDGTPSATSLPTSFNFLTTSPNQVDAGVKAQLNSTGDFFVNSINSADTNRLGIGTFSMATGAQFEVSKSTFVVQTAGNVGIGTNAPTQRLHIADQTTAGAVATLQSFRSSSGSNSQVVFNKARGTIASPSTVTNGDSLGQYAFNGYDGSSYIPSAAIVSSVDGVTGTNDMPGRIGFRTTPDGASATLERMAINNGGYVGIGTSDPQARLNVFESQGSVLGTLLSSNFGHYIRMIPGTCDGCYNGLVKGGDNVLIYSSGTANTGGLVIGQWRSDATLNGMRFAPGGNIGIGTNNPLTKLHVGGPTVSDSVIRLEKDGAAFQGISFLDTGSHEMTLGIGPTSGALYYSVNPASYSEANLASAAKMTILSGGNVGIGTTAPAQKLQVIGDVGLGAIVADNDVNSPGRVFTTATNTKPGDVSTWRAFDTINVGGTSGTAWNSHYQWQATTLGGGSTDSGMRLVAWDSSPSGNYADNTHLIELLRLENNNGAAIAYLPGNVGIGTASPTGKLQINQSNSDPAAFNNPAHLMLYNTYAGNSGWAMINFQTPGGITGGIGEQVTNYTNGTADIAIFTNNAGTRTEKMRIMSGGNVGIGTTSPNDKLDMYSGAIRFYSGSDYQRLFANTWGLNVFTSKLTSSGLRVGEINGSLGLYSGDGATSYNLALTAPSGNAVIIAPNNTTAIYAASSGNVGIGTSNPAYRLELALDSAGKPTTNTWTITSDSRTKEDISDYTVGLNEIKQIRPVTFAHNGLGGTRKGDQGVGVLAQEMRSIFPQTVTEREKIFESTDDVKGFDAEQVVISSAVTREDWTIFNEPEGLMSGTTFFEKNGGGNGVVFKDNTFYFLFPRGNSGKYIEVKNTSDGFVYNLESGGFFSAQRTIVEVAPEKHGYKTKILGFNSHEITFALVNAVKELSTTVENLKARIEVLEGK